MKKSRRLRLAMVRCDCHGFYYGALMAPCYPAALMKYDKIVHYYMTDWYDPGHVIVPTSDDFEIVACYDERPGRAQQFSEAFRGKPRVCATLEQAAQDIDVAFIADCDGGGGDHLRLARPFLKRGPPTCG